MRNRDRNRVWPRNCAHCRKPFIARHPSHLTCGPACREARHNQSDGYHRWKRGKRRSVTKDSDITPQQEAELRRRARKCRICGCWLTSKPGKPNSKHLDHIVPIGVGGTHTHGNVRIICRTCNLARPKDGSDYTGQVTLWAAAPDWVMKPPPKPKPEPERRPPVTCTGCGVAYLRAARGTRCPDCIGRLGREAAELRAAGMEWAQIAERLGYDGGPGALYGIAQRHGGMQRVAS